LGSLLILFWALKKVAELVSKELYDVPSGILIRGKDNLEWTIDPAD